MDKRFTFSRNTAKIRRHDGNDGSLSRVSLANFSKALDNNQLKNGISLFLRRCSREWLSLVIFCSESARQGGKPDARNRVR